MPERRRLRQSVPMRSPKYQPYEEPQPRRPWTRAELEAAVRCVRAMAEDEAAGRDPRRTERIAELATELGRERQAVRMRLNNIVYVLADAGLPVPNCLPPLPGVGRRIAAMILDCWHELDAEQDLAASGQTSRRRPWTKAELRDAVAATRRMGAMEARLGRCLSLDEIGDAVCELACDLGRRWSDTRRILCAVNELADMPEGTAPADATDLSGEERRTLERLLQQGK